MDSTVSNALLLMLIGMISVTMVLMIVVIGGTLLINVVNTFAPQKNIIKDKSVDQETIDDKVLVVIASVVNAVTRGKGKVEQIIKDR